MMERLLDLILPRRSLSGTEGSWITDTERRGIRLTPRLTQAKELQARGLAYLDCVVAAGHYDSSALLRKAIITFKYKRIRSLGRELGHWMTDAMKGLLIPPLHLRDLSPVLCPVPLHWTRRFQRGFYQSLLLAEEIGKRKSWRVANLLVRSRPTGHQTRRTRQERLTALHDAFRVPTGTRVPPSIVLVDDLFTTGATLNECAKALKEAGAEYVAAIVAAEG